MSTKLHQMIAVLTGKKTRHEKNVIELHNLAQKSALYDGISRTYKPLDENGETFPPESNQIQLSVKDVLAKAHIFFADMWDTVATVDVANCEALADVIVGGSPIITGVPSTHLLYLDKQLIDLETFIKHLPVLSPNEQWTWDDNKNAYITAPSSTNRTKKEHKSFIAAPATKEHPAQVHVFTEDVKVGEWTTTKFSGAIPARQKTEMLARVSELRDAVKLAREKANQIDVKQVKQAESLLNYVLG